MLDLDRVTELGGREDGLAVVVTRRSDQSGQASVVNAGVLDHPLSGQPAVGFVVRRGARKLENLRDDPGLTIVFRSGWEWVAVEGDADLVGPMDPLDGVEPTEVPRLLREVYAAAVGGTQEGWAELDEVMATEGHTAVLVRPTRVYSG